MTASINQDGSDLAIVYGVLLPDVHHIAIKYSGVDHTVALAGQSKICIYI